MANAIVNNPRPSKVGYRLPANRHETLYLQPGENAMSVEEAKAILDAPLTQSGKVGLPRKSRTMTQGEWLAALGVTVAWPMPDANPEPEAAPRRAR